MGSEKFDGYYKA
jgi:hypothetical protein